MNLHKPIQAQNLIPCMQFTTASFEREEQFRAWCDFTAAMCEKEAIDPVSGGFLASADSYHLRSLQLTSFKLPRMRFQYTQETIRHGSFDHWCMGIVTKGVMKVSAVDRGFSAGAGDTVLHSFAIPFSGCMEATHFSCLFFSRDDFWDISAELDNTAHQPVLGPMAHILGDFITSLERRADRLTLSDGEAVNESFGHLLRALVRQTPTNIEAARAPLAAAQFERARRHIKANLKAPNLTAELVCRDLGLSRRQLYYLFERHGGVATYIRHQRLAACYDALIKSSEKKLISQVAYEYGFTSLSSFCRQFSARYGFAPSETRVAWLSGSRKREEEATTFIDWLLQAGSN